MLKGNKIILLAQFLLRLSSSETHTQTDDDGGREWEKGREMRRGGFIINGNKMQGKGM